MDFSKSAAYISAITFITKLPSHHTFIIKLRGQHVFHSVCICLSAGSIHPPFIRATKCTDFSRTQKKGGKELELVGINVGPKNIHTFHPHLCSKSIKKNSFISLILSSQHAYYKIHHIRWKKTKLKSSNIIYWNQIQSHWFHIFSSFLLRLIFKSFLFVFLCRLFAVFHSNSFRVRLAYKLSRISHAWKIFDASRENLRTYFFLRGFHLHFIALMCFVFML